MLLSRSEKEKLVIKLAEEGATTREIAQLVHMSLKDIGYILRKHTRDYEKDSERIKRKKKKNNQKSFPFMPNLFNFLKKGNH